MADEEETLVMSLAEGFRRLGKEGIPSADLCRTPLIGVPSMGETQFDDTGDDMVTNELPRPTGVQGTRKESPVSPEAFVESGKQATDPRRGGRKNFLLFPRTANTPVSTTQKVLRRSKLPPAQWRLWRLWLLALLAGAVVGMIAALSYRQMTSVITSSPKQLENSAKQLGATVSASAEADEGSKIEAGVRKSTAKMPAATPLRQSPSAEKPPMPSLPKGHLSRAPKVRNPSAPAGKEVQTNASPNHEVERRALELLLSGEAAEASRLYESLQSQESDEEKARIWGHFSRGAKQLEERGAHKSPSLEEE